LNQIFKIIRQVITWQGKKIHPVLIFAYMIFEDTSWLVIFQMFFHFFNLCPPGVRIIFGIIHVFIKIFKG
jgi:hypothetical protein